MEPESFSKSGRCIKLADIKEGKYWQFEQGDFINVKVLYNSGVSKSHNGKYLYANFIFSDDTENISGKVILEEKSDLVTSFKNLGKKLQVGSIHRISEFEVNLTNPNYTFIAGKRFELRISCKANRVEEATGEIFKIKYLGYLPFNFTQLQKVEKCKPGQFIDIIGVVSEIKDKISKEGLSIQIVVISDNYNVDKGWLAEIVLFGDQINKISKMENCAVAILNGKVHAFERAGTISIKISPITIISYINREQIEELLPPQYHQSEMIWQLFLKVNVGKRFTPSHDINEDVVDQAPLKLFKSSVGSKNNYSCYKLRFDMRPFPSAVCPFFEEVADITYDFTRQKVPLVVEVVKSTQYMDVGEDSYPMRSNPRKGAVLIINNYNFPHYEEKVRAGTEHDVNYLYKFFLACNFHVECERDVTSGNYKDVITNFKNLVKKDSAYLSAMVIIVLSHGSHGYLEMVDGISINYYDDLIHQFDEYDANFPEFKGKPKIFIFQSCQSIVDGLTKKRLFDEPLRNVGGLDNIIVCVPTAAGAEAPRRPEFGSHFMFVLVDIMMKNAHNTNFVEMLKMATNSMKGIREYGILDLPINWLKHRFNKKVYFNPGL